MNSVFFTKRQFKRLKMEKLQKNITHTEAELYIIDRNAALIEMQRGNTEKCF